MDLSWVIKKPLISEKAMSQGRNTYTFLVDQKATKGEIKEAIKQFFGKDILAVRTAKEGGEKKWTLGKHRRMIEKAGTKKAIVQLKEGESFDFYDFPKEEGGKK
ncbi:50S ribosomal protein L23 [Candidatus Shapirobacteria bacterium]|nr:50S ribosomal protein L23 [Candidatus Shapirobacteria bacterium]